MNTQEVIAKAMRSYCTTVVRADSVIGFFTPPAPFSLIKSTMYHELKMQEFVYEGPGRQPTRIIVECANLKRPRRAHKSGEERITKILVRALKRNLNSYMAEDMRIKNFAMTPCLKTMLQNAIDANIPNAIFVDIEDFRVSLRDSRTKKLSIVYISK